MTRFTLLTSTAFAALSLSGAAQAASCVSSLELGKPVLTCASPATTPVTDASDNLKVVVTAVGAVTSTSRDATPLLLDGTNVTVENAGDISNSDTRNNTNAISSVGEKLTVHNTGTISSGDRAIHALDGFAGGLTVTNAVDAKITSRRQTIRTEAAAPGSYVENYGLISSEEGRAIQVRGQGSKVVNHGTIAGGEEVIEARDDFTLENYGTIRLKDGIDDEDGVQFASGTAHNYGLIQGSDDGIDIDEGNIYNYATGQIISTGDGGAGIDVDEAFDNSRDAPRAANPLYIENAGYIEGRYAIGADVAAQSKVTVINSGTLKGRSGRAIDLAPDQGDSTVKVTGNSKIYGDVLFGSGADLFEISGLTSGILSDGTIDGGAGIDTVDFSGYLLTELVSFSFDGVMVDLSLKTSNGVVAGTFTNFENWMFADHSRYTTASLAATFSVSQVPVPAGLPLLLTALVGMVALRRRRA